MFRGSHYEGLRKTYSIWFVLQPRKGEENSLVRYPLVKVTGPDMNTGRPEDCNLLEIIMVKLGGPQDAPNRAFRMFNDIFLSGFKGEEYRNRLRNSYNIEVDDTTLESLERIVMSLGEEIVNFQRRQGYMEARAEMIRDRADIMIDLMSELGLSREDAMRFARVSDEDREDVNRIVDEKLSSN